MSVHDDFAARWSIWAAIGGFWLLGRGWTRARRLRLIREISTSKIRSVAVGLAELVGTAKVLESALTSPVRGQKCVWFLVVVTKRTTDSRGRTYTTEVLRRTGGVPFALDDGTGTIRVEPEGADVDGLLTVQASTGLTGMSDPAAAAFLAAHVSTGWLGGSYTVEERVLPVEAPTYVLGQVESTAASDRRGWRVLELLKSWKADPKRRDELDTNRDGKLEDDEWEAARSAAQAAALTEIPASTAPVLAVRAPKSQPYLIASGTERDAIADQGWPTLSMFTGLGLLLLVLWAALTGHL